MSDPVKRSAHVGLLVMGALGVSAASGAFLSQREQTCRSDPANQADPEQRCRHSGGSSGAHGSSHSGWSRSGTADAASQSGADAASSRSAVSRGGFGSIGHSLGLFGSGRS